MKGSNAQVALPTSIVSCYAKVHKSHLTKGPGIISLPKI
jgi:hypothetical protein